MFKRRQAERELDDELRFHLEKQIEKHMAAGMSPDEARRQALIAFGGVQQTKENVRETRGIHFFDVSLKTRAMLAYVAEVTGIHLHRRGHTGTRNRHEHGHLQPD